MAVGYEVLFNLRVLEVGNLKKIWVLDISEPEIGKPSANGLIVDFTLALSAPHGLSYNNSVLLSAQKSLQTLSK